MAPHPRMGCLLNALVPVGQPVRDRGLMCMRAREGAHGLPVGRSCAPAHPGPDCCMSIVLWSGKPHTQSWLLSTSVWACTRPWTTSALDEPCGNTESPRHT